MAEIDRRTLLKVMGAGAFIAALPANVTKALAVPANNRTGTIEDVEHIVVLMQENRSFDHYFGTLRGVRGFNDPHAVNLPSGKPVWHQPDGDGELLPFRPDVADMGRTFLPDPPHGWNDTHAAWNGGRHDGWVANKGVDTMTFHTRADIPFQYALADAFTICDAYHCSLLGPTDPNRYHLWTGWVGNDGTAGGPVITNAEAGYDWSTFPERLERAGVSWKVYQDVGTGLDAAGSWGWTGDQPYIGNYGDNALLYFHQYQNALTGNPLADKAKVGTNIAVSGTPFDQFRADVEAGTLPQVSWIVAPEAFTEHPNWAPDFGAWYVSQCVDILASNHDLWSKTVMFLNYDEEGGFFDHTIPPTPAATPDLGASTVDIVNEIFPGTADHPAGPYGLGMRVPMIVVSPWSKGGFVNSQLFDHTSVIRFIERRFGTNGDLTETNITPWRRAVVGDLTSAFDFATPNARRVRLPDTSGFAPTDDLRHDDLDVVAPDHQTMAKQERGVRPARALPYELDASASIAGDGSVTIHFVNTGAVAVVFHARSAAPSDQPRTYTVEPGKQLAGTWTTPSASRYDITVLGPNGFVRRFAGATGPDVLDIDLRVSYRTGSNEVAVTATNHGDRSVTLHGTDHYTGQRAQGSLAPGVPVTGAVSVEHSHGWYDLVVTTDQDPSFVRRIAGHLETGQDSTSDPAMGGLVRRWG